MMTSRGRPRTRAAFATEESLRLAREAKARHVAELEVEIERETNVAMKMLAHSSQAYTSAKIAPLRRALAAETRELRVMDVRLALFEEQRRTERDRKAQEALAQLEAEFAGKPMALAILKAAARAESNGHDGALDLVKHGLDMRDGSVTVEAGLPPGPAPMADPSAEVPAGAEDL